MNWKLSTLIFTLCLSYMAACGSGTEQKAVSAGAEDEAAGQEAKVTQEAEQEKKVIIFYGNSLTAGYGLDQSEAFPALIQQRLDSLGYNYRVVNAGLSGETTAGGNQRLDWVLERQPVDVFVLELGANDGLRGVDPAATQQNLEEMIDKVRKANPKAEIILAGMMVPPSMGQEYSRKFSQIFPEVAKKKDVRLIPFLLEDVAGERELNQADGIHPTAEGQKILARNVWQHLKEALEKPQQ